MFPNYMRKPTGGRISKLTRYLSNHFNPIMNATCTGHQNAQVLLLVVQLAPAFPHGNFVDIQFRSRRIFIKVQCFRRFLKK